MNKLKIGLTNKFEKRVLFDDTAEMIGSGNLQVFATPMMIAMMESASKDLVQPYLEEGKTTVGTSVDVKHIAATKMGKKVWAIAELIEMDQKKFVFKVEAFDENKKIGEGTHERFIVDCKKFLSKL